MEQIGMPENKKDTVDLDQELDDLRQELEYFQQEKDRIRSIIGKIGGMLKFHSKFFNIILIILTVGCLALSIVVDDTSFRLLMIEIASAAVSLKIIYLIHCQMKVNHFKLWMMSSIEWRLNELTRIVRDQKNDDKDS